MRSRQNNSREPMVGEVQKPGRSQDVTRGVALIITLILLVLLSAGALAMVMLVSSDTMINGYYRNYRGSFYAADSGVNVIVETMKNAIQNDSVVTANPPLPANGLAPINAAIAPYQNGYFTIGDAGSWPAQFTMVANRPAVPGNPAPPAVGAPSCNPSGAGGTNVTCTYPYTVTVLGQSTAGQAEEITETGTIAYTSTPGTGAVGGGQRFSGYGGFITKFGDCTAPLVPGTMSGPFFTDDQWNFGNFSNPGYTFTDTVGQVGAKVSWWKNNQCTDSATAPNGFKQPNFQGGLQLSQQQVVPPSDTYNQAQAVLDGKGIPPCTAAPCPADPPPSQAQMNQVLKTINGTTYPSQGNASNGVYIPWYTDGQGHQFYGSNPANGGDGAGGGFYVNGDASITLSATTGGDGSANATQTYTIKQTQGHTTTTTTIVVDNVSQTTTVSSGGLALTLQGVPTQLDPNTGQAIIQTDPSGNPVNPTMVYVNGQITGLSGTVQNNTGITVAASSNVSITSDITYLQSPVSIPGDTLNATTNAGVLGICTNGNINLYPDSGGNLTVNASLAAIGSGTSGFETPKQGINTWTVVGGRCEDQAHGVNIGTGNTYFDRRFANNFGPPWFPTAVPQPGQTGSAAQFVGISVTRTSWQEVNR